MAHNRPITIRDARTSWPAGTRHGASSRGVDLVSIRHVAWAVFGLTSIGAFLLARDVEAYLGFIAVFTTACIPFFVWTRRGAVQLPIFPVATLFYVPSYANAALRNFKVNYTSDQVIIGELTVALFLGVATTAWMLVAYRKQPRVIDHGGRLVKDSTLLRLMFSTLFAGVLFPIGMYSGWWVWTGSTYGTIRTFASSASLLGCFLYGAVLGMRRFKWSEQAIGALLVLLVLILDASSLYLYTSITDFITVCLGYFLLSRKVPWTAMAIGFLLAATLHSAERQMREEHWSRVEKRSSFSLSEIPDIMTEWAEAGIGNLVTGTQEDRENFANRASMLPNLLLVQQDSPEIVSYLHGETYANFWKMLVPRFLVPGKITSQTNLNLLSVHYGLLTVKDTTTTTISWGLVSEGYANFGILGVVLSGLAFGALLGWLTHWTASAPTISMRGFIGLASMVVPITSVAYDFSFLLLNLLQSIATMVALFLCFKYVSRGPQ